MLKYVNNAIHMHGTNLSNKIFSGMLNSVKKLNLCSNYDRLDFIRGIDALRAVFPKMPQIYRIGQLLAIKTKWSFVFMGKCSEQKVVKQLSFLTTNCPENVEQKSLKIQGTSDDCLDNSIIEAIEKNLFLNNKVFKQIESCENLTQEQSLANKLFHSNLIFESGYFHSDLLIHPENILQKLMAIALVTKPQ